MACRNQEWTRLVPVYTKANVATKVFFATAPVLRSADFDQARISFEIVNTEANVTVERAYRESNDGVTWSAPTVFGTAGVTAAGWHYGGFNALSGLDNFVEVGVLVNAGTIQYGEVNALTTVRMG
jgi:hypothetical protein